MPDPCDYDDKDEFVSACVSVRQDEDPSEDTDQSVAACINIWDNRDCKSKSMSDKKVIHKVGLQSESDPFEFVMSTETSDRYGDIVEQDWKLAHFKKNPIALWNHQSSSPIGLWRKVRVEQGRLKGVLKLAEKGTSDLVDMLRSMIEQRILKAVSVGFRPGEVEPLDEKNPWNGYRLKKNELLECSLVSVPANPEALSVAKALTHKSERMVRELFSAETGYTVPECPSAADQLGCRSRDSDTSSRSTRSTRPTTRKSTVSLQDKIQAKQDQVADLQVQLKSITESEDFDAENISEEISLQITELSDQIAAAQADLEPMLRAEKALADIVVKDAPASKPADKTAPVPRITTKQNLPKGFRSTAAVSCMVKAHGMHTSPYEIAKGEYKDNPELEQVIRAATDPATTTDAAWAAPLVRETWGEFMDLIRDVSVYPRLPGLRLEFDRYGKINIPFNNGRGKLAGGFVAEGAPIPVKEGAFGTTDLMPKKMAIITSFTKEIAEHSIPAIQGLVQNQMVEDTAEVLDSFYLDNGARDTTRPAGLQDPTETGAANINASTGNTIAAIHADTQAMIGRLLASKAGNAAVWVMNPLRVLGLRDGQDAASGEFTFRAEIDAGQFRGYPFISSQNVPEDVVYLQGSGAMAYGNDYGPRINVSDETTLVYDDTAPDQVLPATNAQPAKSMFQMEGIAVKLALALDWRQVRPDAVQVLTAVGW